MFGRKKSRLEELRDRIDYELAREQARDAARHARDWAEPRYEAARDWAEPRARRAYRAGARRATPFVERAGETVEDWTDAARDAIVGSAIPAVIGAFRRAGDDSEDRRFPWAAVVIPAAVIGAAAAAVVVWAKTDPGPQGDEGDEEWDEATDLSARLARTRTQINAALTSAEEAVGHMAQVVATTSGAAVSAVSEAAQPYAKKVRDTAEPYAKKVRDSAAPTVDKVKKSASAGAKRARSAGKSVADEVEKAMEDFENVWGDDADEAKTTKKAAPKTTTKKTEGES